MAIGRCNRTLDGVAELYGLAFIVALITLASVSRAADDLPAADRLSTAAQSTAPSPGAASPGAASPGAASLDSEKLRADLAQSLSQAALVGNFTVTGEKKADLTPERYELSTVRHLGEDKWLFEVRIRYGEHDVALPLTLPIRWAGDTPVITVDNLGVPGLGVYTARVMIFRDHYAGFWTGADHGGHLFGVIERDKDEKEAP